MTDKVQHGLDNMKEPVPKPDTKPFPAHQGDDDPSHVPDVEGSAAKKARISRAWKNFRDSIVQFFKEAFY